MTASERIRAARLASEDRNRLASIAYRLDDSILRRAIDHELWLAGWFTPHHESATCEGCKSDPDES